MIKPSELPLAADGSLYHIHLTSDTLADKVLLVGDPDRVDMFKGIFDSVEHGAYVTRAPWFPYHYEVTKIVFENGVKRIGQVTSYMVPFMSAFYILAGIFVIILRLPQLPGAFVSIISGAFNLKAVGGGVFGYAMMLAIRQGVARGVFSNEAGLGSAPIAHSASSTVEPCEQAIWGIFEVFVDTIIICTITSLAVVMSGILDNPGGLDAFASKGAAAAAAFNMILPGHIGGLVIQVSLMFFSLSTIIGWSYYGERCWAYLTNENKIVNITYKIIFVLFCIVGAVGSGTLMWDISDTLNGLMAIPNLISLLLLSGIIISATKEYFSKLK